MKKYMFLFGKHKVELLILSFSIIISSILQISITYIGGTYIDLISTTLSIKSIYIICLFLVFLSLSSLITKYLIYCIMNPLIEKIVFNFEYFILEHLKKVSVIEYKKFSVAYLTKRIEEDSRQVSHFFVSNYTYAFVKCLEIISIVIIVLRISLVLGLIMILLCPIYLSIYRRYRKPIYDKNLEVREKSAEYFQGFSNHLEYLEDIIIDANFQRENNILERINQVYLQKFKEFVAINNKFTITQGIIVAIMQITIYLIGGVGVFFGYTTVGSLSILISYFIQVLANITYYNDLAKTYQTTKTAIHRLDVLINMPTIAEGTAQLNEVTSIKANIDYSIEDRHILNNINVEAHKGEVVGIIGRNGSGKTTLLKLLVGALKFNENDTHSSIVYNNLHDIREMDCLYLRNNFLAYVPQKTRLRNFTMKEVFNEIGDYNTYNDFIDILNKNNISCSSEILLFIENNWTKQMSTLSGGDKQLVEILRNVLRQTDMLFFDEPTLNLDIDRIEWFNQLIGSIKKEMIIFIITHDNQLFSVFDKIVHIES